MKILIVIGTRPNFIKVTQFRRVAEELGGIEIKIVHTGQHYDQKMSGIFFEQFSLQPDHFQSLRGDLPAEQFGNMITDLGALMVKIRPDAVIVPGDVNSTLAGALAANRCGLPVYHLESGLRSFDRTMPEEVNRILVDQITDKYFITEQSGLDNLKKEGLCHKNGKNEAYLVGNTMIDTLIAYDDEIQSNTISSELEIEKNRFALLTMHRPSNVDNLEGLAFIQQLVENLTNSYPVVFPIHPRTKNKFQALGLWEKFSCLQNLKIIDPLDYFAFQKLISDAAVVITDSGGIQEETTFRQTHCITIRPNTERPSTITMGTNHLVEREMGAVLTALENPKQGEIPPNWDGKTTERILKIIKEGQ
jgi:UDP-N-acetylglucosamine 2-epimerase (non-hydrolysing)